MAGTRHHRWTGPRLLYAAAAVSSVVLTVLTAGVTGTPLAMAATGASAGNRGAPIVQAVSETAIAESYIVVFDDAAVSRSDVERRALDLSGRYGGTLGHIYRDALRGFEVGMPQAAAQRLAANPAVRYIEQNQTVSISLTQSPTPSWGLDRIDQRSLPLNNSYSYPTTGSNVRVYVIDSGIRFTHQDFGGRAVSGWDVIDNDNDASDCLGHGTLVAGTIGGSSYGVAKSVRLVGVRVLGCSGTTTFAAVIAGVDWVAGDHDPGELAVANMSLRSSISQAVNDAVTGATADGVTFAVAAGNDSADACAYSPASTPSAITVGATQSDDARASYSNIGGCLDIFAPGSATTTSFTSDTATSTADGTSIAAPYVAGAAALLLSANPSFTPQQVHDKIVADASTGVVTNPGTGSPNRLLHVTPPASMFTPELTAGFTHCAVEAGQCSFTGTRVVAYGAGSYVYKTATSSTACTTAAFGSDPAAERLKSCYVAPLGGPSGYQLCSAEGGTCAVSGHAYNLAYGANGAFNYRVVTGNTACTYEVLGGDPLYGVAKNCYLAPAGAPAGGWRQCSVENGTCVAANGQPLAYGAYGAFTFTTATGNMTCNNVSFGDPIRGVVKSCYARVGAPAGYATTCAGEGGTCAFTGAKTVAYGALGRFVYKTFSGATACTNVAFGNDPMHGVPKSCYLTP